jgi:hypothetical protein
MFNNPHLCPKANLLNKKIMPAPALGATKFIFVKDMILVTLCCDTQVRHRCSRNQPQ